MSLARDNGRIEFKVLDSWRGICALLIAFFHFEVGRQVGTFTFHGNLWIFVDFFFVLSGFVIQHSYGTQLARSPDRWSFLIKRFGRIWPLHFAALLALLALELAKGAVMASGTGTATALFSGRFTVEGLVASVFMVNAWGLFAFEPWNGPAWSISAEWAAYIAFALVSCAPPTMRTWSAAAIVFGCGAILILSGVYLHTTAELGVIRCLFSYFLGVLSYVLFTNFGEAASRILNSGHIGTATEVFMVSILITVLSFAVNQDGFIIVPFVFSAIVLIFSFKTGIISRYMSNRFFANIGAISYSIYIIHDPILNYLFRLCRLIENKMNISIYPEISPNHFVLDIADGAIQTVAIYLIYFCVLLAVSALTYRFIELPWRERFRQVANHLGHVAYPSDREPLAKAHTSKLADEAEA